MAREDGGREDGVSPAPPSSPRVRLEVAFLDADETAAAPAPPPALDDGNRLTVLVVAAEADLRRYVRECLRDRPDLRLLEAASVAAAVALAGYDAPGLLVVDEPERDVVDRLTAVRAIVIVDDVPHDALAASGMRVRLLARPFSADRLEKELKQLTANG